MGGSPRTSRQRRGAFELDARSDAPAAKPLVAFIVGPTGTGKSAAAMAVAAEIPAEIVSADSMQFYRGMDVGTAKPSAEDRASVPHHLIDIVEPDEPYNVADFHRDATAAIEEVLSRGRLPLVVGGSGLYVRALANELDLPIAEPDEALRQRLRDFAKHSGPDALHDRLRKVDPASADRIHPRDQKKIIRPLEVYEKTGRPLSELHSDSLPPSTRYDCRMFGLTCDREELYRRVEERCNAMINSGLLKEVQTLLDRGLRPELQSMQAIGYKEMAAFLRGEVPFPEATETFKRNTRRYVKRQLTWFRADERIQWIDIAKEDPAKRIVEALRRDLGVGEAQS